VAVVRPPKSITVRIRTGFNVKLEKIETFNSTEHCITIVGGLSKQLLGPPWQEHAQTNYITMCGCDCRNKLMCFQFSKTH